MAEYIEREALRKSLVDRQITTNFFRPLERTEDGCIIEMLDEAPAADVEPVRPGRWKYYHKQNKAVCTNCSFERDLDANFGRAISCPNCGAKMDATDINVGDKGGDAIAAK
jgi:hypothetical protein